MEVGLGPGHIVLDWVPASAKGAIAAPPVFGPCLLWPRSPISAAAELLLLYVVSTSAVRCLERPSPKVTYYVSRGTLGLFSLTHS